MKKILKYYKYKKEKIIFGLLKNEYYFEVYNVLNLTNNT